MKNFAPIPWLVLTFAAATQVLAQDAKKDEKTAASNQGAPESGIPSKESGGADKQANPTQSGAPGVVVPAVPPPAPKPLQTTSLDSLFKLVPEGRPHKGLRYPVMENGNITSFIQSERMTRIDENSLQFEDAIIDQKGETPMKFKLVRAVYNRVTGQLMSNQHSVIENADYTIEGDSLNYDRKSTVSRMTNIRMTIYNMSGLSGTPETTPAPVSGDPEGSSSSEKKDTKSKTPVEKAAAPESPAPPK